MCSAGTMGLSCTWELINRNSKQTGANVTARAGPLVSHQLALFAGGFVFSPTQRGSQLSPFKREMYLCSI